MKKLINPKKEEIIKKLKRPELENNIYDSVKQILNDVKNNGDSALKYYSNKFDSIELDNLIEYTKNAVVPKELEQSILKAKKNIEKFHLLQIPKKEELFSNGMRLERIPLPINPVGIYIPGGTAPLFSTVLMLAIPAKIAGCNDIILCTPPPINPAILYAAKICGIDKVFQVGGAQAIGAMAYGTKSISKCAKIFGPGNNYVTTAKKIVSMENTAIDMPAGPSEVLVLADEKAEPAFVASDLLSQAEHGSTSQVVLIFVGNENEGKKFLLNVEESINNQMKALNRKEIVQKSLENSYSIIFANMEDAIDTINFYAPEHFIINIKDSRSILKFIKTAGSVFIGQYSPESAGDYASGTNHTLPTGGWGHSYSGVSVDSFIRKMTIQELSFNGLEKLGQTIMTMAEFEGLDAHKNAVKIRLEKK